jgi:hypothetical protein
MAVPGRIVLAEKIPEEKDGAVSDDPRAGRARLV